ncbi:MAG TPA: TlpA disulfide reductase family protein [Kofleriaceae bacterium]|jgi:peroxiredoxin|nr:TlpA disulfide reductase family protein [Kofleriaceae bacterium]
MQRGALAALGASIAAACHAPAPATGPDPSVVTAAAGLPRFDDSDASWLGHRSWDEYVHDADEFRDHRIVLLTAPHPAASPEARYGINLISGGRNVSWVLDGDPDHGYWLAIDENGNGVLTDDPVHQLVRGPADWRVEVATAPRAAGGPPLRTIVAFDGKMVRSYEMMVRTGQLVIDGRPLRFTISCQLADCSNPRAVRLGFDLDGNGTVDLRPGSDERYQPDDRTVVAFGRSYDFAIAADGSRLTLRRSQVAHAPRPTLRTGSPAPVFEARDDHARFSLAAARGRVVLLDFFDESCHVCIEDLPWLAGVHDRYAGAGLALVTIAAGAPPPGVPPWPVVVERDAGSVAALYRIAAYPSYFVIDRDGTIACAHCQHEVADHALAQQFADRPR